MPRDKAHMTASQLANIQGRQFKPGQSGNIAGRPKNKFNLAKFFKKTLGKKRAKMNENLTAEEISTWERLMLALRLPDIRAIAKADDTPMFAKGLAFAIMNDTKNGKTTTIDKLRERQYGTTKEQIELTGANGEPLLQPIPRMTPERARLIIAEITMG